MAKRGFCSISTRLNRPHASNIEETIMSKETLISEPIVASIVVDRSGPNRLHRSMVSEFALIARGLRVICDPDRDHLFIIFGRAHKVVPTRPTDSSKGTLWRPTPGGGGEAQIVLARVDEPAQQVRLSYKLVGAAGEDPESGWLTAEFNPTTILAGNNVHPATIADPETGEICAYPSSDLTVMRQMHRLGFNLLDELDQQAMGTNRPLFRRKRYKTRAAIDSGDFHIVRARWRAYLPTSDVPQFLQVLTALTGHHIRRGTGIIHLANHLGFSFEKHSHEKTDDLTGVLLKKKHGDKPLFSLGFYDKRKRIAGMKQGKTSLPAKVATIRDNVRFDITAHSEGVVAIANAARRRLKASWLMEERGVVPPEEDWIEDFLSGEVEATAWWLETAIFVLSHRLKDGLRVRKSFAEWLVPYMINDMLRLDLITGFTRDNFHRFVALDDKVAAAWRADETAEPKGWATRLAKEAGCSVQTVYTRQKEWLKTYVINIAVPHALYRDLLFYGPPSMTRPQHRSDLINAVREKNGDDAIRLHERAAMDFDRKRTEVVGATIKSRPHAMEVKVARNTALAPARVGVADRSQPTVAAQASAPQTVRQTGTKKPITITAQALATVQRHPVQQGRLKAVKHAPRQDSDKRRSAPSRGKTSAPTSSHAPRR
jgi:hypothetical protein